MPELPEVETVRRGLEVQTQGLVIERVEVMRNRAIAHPPDPGLFCLALQGCRVHAWQRRGKYLLASLRERHGLTYLMVTHDLGVVAHLCERIGVMAGGRLVEVLSREDLRAGLAQAPATRSLLDACAEPA